LKYQVNEEYFLRELQRSDDIGLDGFINGDPYGHHLIHCYKGRSLLFNHGDLEGETRLEMTGSTSSIHITKK